MREVFDLLSRNTADVDCLIAVESGAALEAELEKAGFICFEEKAPFRRFRLRLDPLMLLDVMRVNAGTFEKMWRASETFEVTGLTVRVPALAHLVALKLHAAQNEHRAQKDMADIMEILAANPGRITAGELRKLCDQFGTPALSGQLHAFL